MTRPEYRLLPEVEYEHWADMTLAVCFAGSFDTFCRRLDRELLEQAWRQTSEVLTGLEVDPSGCRWGWVHPGRMQRADRSEVETPIDGFGWLIPADRLAHTGLTLPSQAWVDALVRIDAVFATCDPPLMAVICEARSMVINGTNGRVLPTDDGDVGLKLLIDQAMWDMTDWRPRADAGEGPWANMALAMWNRNNHLFNESMSAALREYTPAGAELVVRGFSDFLLHWLRPDAARNPDVE